MPEYWCVAAFDAAEDRRPTTGALLVDAMDATYRPFPAPDTGSVVKDVTEILTGFVTLLERTPFPRLLAAFIDAAERDPALSEIHQDLTRRRREPMLTVLRRGRERGELAADTDPELTTDLLTSPFFYRHFVAHRPIPRRMVDDVVARVLVPERPSAESWQTVRTPSAES